MTTTRKRLTITCDSHTLSAYQRCPEAYRLAYREHYETVKTKRAFARGRWISEKLQTWYKVRKRINDSEKGLRIPTKWTLRWIEKLIIFKTIELKFEDEGDSELIAKKLKQYFKYYQDESWRIIAAETGFSKILYEDSYVLFIYEGRPDLVVAPIIGQDKIAVVDHKSESRKSNLWKLRNQFIGYVWGLDTDIMIVNYFGLQASFGMEESFRRVTLSYTSSQIEQWRQDTIKWYYKILVSIVNDDFNRSWQCEGKYGLCSFSPVCEQTLVQIKDNILKNEFKIRNRAWKAW